MLARQSRAVNAAKTVTEGLVRAIAEEVASQRQKGVSYGATGVQTPTAAATAITLNKRLRPRRPPAQPWFAGQQRYTSVCFPVALGDVTWGNAE